MTFRKTLTIITLAGALAISGCNVSERNESKGDKIDPEVRAYVTQNIGSIISSQEKTLGIQHFGLPNLDIRGCGFRGDREFYNPDTDILKIYVPRAYVHFSPATTEDIIRHGLGHFYADKLSESLGLGSWPPDDKEDIDYVRKNIICEGIAEYFRRKSKDEEDTFKDSQWPKTLEEFENIDFVPFYTGGYHLVKPIIDRHGKKGIKYLILNPPEIQDLKDLLGYQKRALEDLSKSLK